MTAELEHDWPCCDCMECENRRRAEAFRAMGEALDKIAAAMAELDALEPEAREAACLIANELEKLPPDARGRVLAALRKQVEVI